MATMEKQKQSRMGPLGVIRGTFPYLKYYKSGAALICIMLVVQITYTILLPLITKFIIDDVIVQANWSLLAILLTVLLGLFLFSAASLVFGDYLIASVGIGILNRVRVGMLEQLQRVPTGYFQKTKAGDLVNRFTNDLTVVETALVGCMPFVFRSAIEICLGTALLFFLEWRLALLTLLLLPGVLAISKPFRPRATRFSHEQKQEEADVSSVVQEDVLMHLVIKVFRIQDVCKRRLMCKLSELKGSFVKSRLFGALVGKSTSFAFDLLTLVILGVGALMVIVGYHTVGSLVAFLGLLRALGAAVTSIGYAMLGLYQAVGGMQRVQDLLHAKTAVLEAEDAKNIPPLSKDIRFKDVSFSYEGGDLNLDSVSLTIGAGEKVAFVGTSGSGKSTVLKLLMRLYQPQQGSILFDGHNMFEISDESLRKQVAVVLQDTTLFNLSIRENIRLGQIDASDEEVIEAAKSAEIHDIIMSLPSDYDYEVGERGDRLSGGQRQRIAIARALLHRPRILLLDEITSALDPATEAAINKTLARLGKKITTISVTHRLTAVVGMNRVFVMDRGRLVEAGTHEELLTKRGHYYELWEKQTGVAAESAGGGPAVRPEYLRTVPLFSNLDDTVLKNVATLFSVANFGSDEVVIRQGEVGDRFYLISRGAVSVCVAKEERQQQVALLDAGDFFGEIALYENTPRTATVKTCRPCTLLVLHRTQFEKIIDEVPGVRDKLEGVIAARQSSTKRLQTTKGRKK